MAETMSVVDCCLLFGYGGLAPRRFFSLLHVTTWPDRRPAGDIVAGIGAAVAGVFVARGVLDRYLFNLALSHMVACSGFVGLGMAAILIERRGLSVRKTAATDHRCGILRALFHVR
ncbi:MAG: hypothetical protein H6649_09975 [Caldilineae bacterium]|nr:hypothetical protein [Caldilineae bacterium]